MNKFISIIVLALFISCGDKKAGEPPKDEVQQPVVESNFVVLTDLQIKTAGIELGTIELKNLKSSIKANGMLAVPNHNKALVTSVSSGVVRTLTVHPGDVVHQGQTIATIVNPDVARMQQELQAANAQINLAEIELKRQRELVEGNAAPLKNVQRIQTELATLKATRNALEKQLTTMGIPVSKVSGGEIITTLAVVAPISGTVSHVSAQIGSNIDPSTPVAEIVNNSQLHLDLFVYEKDLPKLHDNQTIHFTLTNNPGKEYDAQVYSIGTAFASESKTIPVHAVVKGDKSGLIEGMNITAIISIGETIVPAVPNDAIVTYQGQDYIFVLGKEQQHEANFERVQVVKGVSDIGYTEITLLRDIPADAKIIVKGAFFANAKMTNAGGNDE